jgi:preprotein translocase subunit YajC
MTEKFEKIEKPAAEGAPPAEKLPEKPKEIKELEKQLSEIRPGDIIVSRSGTQRKITKIEGDQIYFERIDVGGKVTEGVFPLEKFIAPAWALTLKEIKKAAEVAPTEKPIEKPIEVPLAEGVPPVEAPKSPEKRPGLITEYTAHGEHFKEFGETGAETNDFYKMGFSKEHSEKIEKQMRAEPHKIYETRSRKEITIKKLDEEVKNLEMETDPNKRKWMADELVTVYTELGMRWKAESIWRKLMFEEKSKYLGNEFTAGLKKKIDDEAARLLIGGYKKGNIAGAHIQDLYGSVLKLELLKDLYGADSKEYQEAEQRAVRFNEELEEIKERGIGIDAESARLSETQAPLKKETFNEIGEKFKEMGKEPPTEKQFEKLCELSVGGQKYANEFRRFGKLIARIENPADKDFIARLYTSICRSKKYYREGLLASEFISDEKLREKAQTEMQADRLDNLRKYFKKQLKFSDEEFKQVSPLFENYKPIRRYPEAEAIEIKEIKDAYRDLQEKLIPERKVPFEEMQAIVSKMTGEEAAQKVEQAAKEGLFKKIALTGAGVLALLLIIIAGPLVVGMYAGMKELAKGFAKEIGFEKKAA